MEPHLTDFSVLGLIVLFPLLGAIINGLIGAKMPEKFAGWVANSAIFLSFMFSMVAVWTLFKNAATVVENGEETMVFGKATYVAYEWIYSGTLSLDIAFLLDPLSAVMILVITGVGFLIHLYSVGYMEHDPAKWKYFAYLNLFCFAMLMLVLGKNMLVTFIGWEGVGVCSYLLIGFWYTDEAKAQAGQKAFIVNRVGDFAFLSGLFILFYETGTLDYVALEQIATTPATAITLLPVALPAALLIFIGCTGKSAQIPLYTWLPDAMAGPTPVSALIHAATMVTAGVFLISRLNYIFSMDPLIGIIIATIGVLTAFFAATMALVQNDIKGVLAYSTISQLGYMFLAVGVGAYGAGVFHLMTHAFFKALLFLGSGSVIHAMHEEQDIRKMGGLRKYMPITAGTFLIACLAISGIPIFSGFFSKDLILWQALAHSHILTVPEVVEGGVSMSLLTTVQASPILSEGPVDIAGWAVGFHWFFFIMGLITAGLTAFYMFRLYFLTFEGECRASEEVKKHIHESPPAMAIPLLVLGILSVIGGLTGWPHFMVPAEGTLHDVMLAFELWLDEVWLVSENYRYFGRFGAHPYVQEGIAAGVSVVVAASGIALAWFMYLKKTELPGEIADRVRGLYRVLENKYWVDEAYDASFVQGTIGTGRAWTWFDQNIIDGLLVNGTGWLAEQLGKILRHLQSGNVQRYAVYITLAVVLFLLAVMYPG
ncbi:NADH-quinone oxidoreductase subunit L [Persicimonas caeni]|uniref:NADH-quinone oxidoreductase subunit L n=1 Tax=Persicimonas caeni TaxID=2292766 RepID=A0A4Y6PLV0_PERCE|nr:NADH-quinone oxidoreductase subunit L [Persicimonas caeni]QDG49199.1 NADH-quinone oxidoreductase subunit L [Persicimonas caeni]QED30420.1 NADH-quinone oxidoreductase subunit L [Persicimonas caeni]